MFVEKMALMAFETRRSERMHFEHKKFKLFELYTLIYANKILIIYFRQQKRENEYKFIFVE